MRYKPKSKRSLIPKQVRGLQNRIIDRSNNKEYMHSPVQELSVQEYLKKRKEESLD